MLEITEQVTPTVTVAPPAWSAVLRALRAAQGATQAGWAAQLAVSRTTVQRWERGEVAPDPDMERSLLEHCAARGLYRAYTSGPLAGQTVSAAWLGQILAEARMSNGAAPASRLPASAAAVQAAGSPPAERRAPVPAAPRTRTGTPVIGRGRELTVLRAALHDAQQGGGRLVLLGGEPGIGKSTLCETLATEAGDTGTLVLWGRCWEGGGAPALWPWTQIIAAATRGVSPEALRGHLGAEAAAIAQLVPEVQALLGDTPPPPPADPDTARFRLFGAVASSLAHLAAQRPLLLVLEDLHWADAPSLLLLRFVAQRLAAHRIMIAATYRDIEVTSGCPLAETLAALHREPVAERLPVAGLSREDVSALVAALAEGDLPPPGDALAASLHQGTGGNPLFIREYVRNLAESGRLASADAATPAGPALTLPDGVREVISSRLARVSPSCSDALTVAAVAGDEFALDLLTRIGAARSSVPSGDVMLDALDEAETARLLRSTGAGRYQFAHALIREAVYDALPSGRRARLHGWVAEALEERYRARAGEHATELAHHFGQAAAISPAYAAEALAYATQAGAQAEAATAWNEAARHYEQCLSLLTGLDEHAGDEAALLLSLGRCQRNAALWRDAWRNLMRAVSAYRARADAEGAARATLEALVIDLPPERRDALVDAALADLHDAPDLEARLLARRIVDAEITEETDSLAQRAAELATRHNLPDVQALLERREAIRALMHEQTEAMVAGCRRAHAQFAALGQTVDAARMLNWAAMAWLGAGDLRRGEREAETALAYARSIQAQANEEQMLAALAGARLARHELDGCTALLDRIAGESYWVPILQVRLSERQGELEAAASLLPAVASANGVPFSLAMIHGARARILWRLGRRDEAERELDAWTAAMFGERNALVNQTRIYAFAEVEAALAALAPPALVERAYREVAARTATRFSPWTAINLDHVAGTLALRLGLPAEAAHHFRTGLAWSEQEGCPVDAGRCLLGLAAVEQAAGHLDLAADHAARAAALFERHDAWLYFAEAVQLRRPAG